jgi:hypothetical protein
MTGLASSIQDILKRMISGELVDAGVLRVSKTSLGRKKPGERYLVYLPVNRNYLWRTIHDSGLKVRVFIEVPGEALKEKNISKES